MELGGAGTGGGEHGRRLARAGEVAAAPAMEKGGGGWRGGAGAKDGGGAARGLRARAARRLRARRAGDGPERAARG